MGTLGRVVRAVCGLVLLVFGWLTYKNVWSPVEPIQDLAEKAACGVKDCTKRHGVTKIDRSSFGQTFELTWEDGTVIVTCRPESYAFGPNRCKVQS